MACAVQLAEDAHAAALYAHAARGGSYDTRPAYVPPVPRLTLRVVIEPPRDRQMT